MPSLSKKCRKQQRREGRKAERRGQEEEGMTVSSGKNRGVGVGACACVLERRKRKQRRRVTGRTEIEDFFLLEGWQWNGVARKERDRAPEAGRKKEAESKQIEVSFV